MYSHEIEQILKNQNYNIDSETYVNICDTSTQISKAKYNSYNDKYELWTSDNYYWKFSVYRKDDEQ